LTAPAADRYASDMSGRRFAFFSRSRVFPAIVAAVLCVIVCCRIAFLNRAPVVVVSDAAFELLYGENRAVFERRLFALRVFRPVRLALVSEEAAPAASAEAAAASSEGGKAACVLFPLRYLAGAEAFKARFPAAITVVVGGPPSGMSASGLVRLSVDRATDLYRAGRISGLLGAGRIPVLRIDAARSAPLIDAFKKGLADASYAGASAVQNVDEPAPKAEDSSLFTDAASGTNGSPAAVVFSWSDPAFLPEKTLIVFDDSPVALLYQAYRAGMVGRSTVGASIVRMVGLSKMPLAGIIGIQAAARASRN
jgi:hypothetical protein